MVKYLCIVLMLCVFAKTEGRNRIIGGLPVKIEEFPYQLQLLYNNQMLCGAVLISNNTALTAAHCIPKQGVYSVRAGTSHAQKGGVVRSLKQIILHPSWKRDYTDYDVAILVFKKPLKLSSSIKPAKLPTEDYSPSPGTKGWVSGWGYVYPYIASTSLKLRAVELPVVNIRSCRAVYPFATITNRMFCAGYKEGGKDACMGDSGGPFVVDGVLYGLVSWGINCAEPGYPGVYTNIATLKDYIVANAKL